MTTTDAADQMRSNLDLIGREDVNDTLEIYSLIGHEEPEGTHAVEDNCAAEFTWDYTKGARPKLDKLYEKAKGAQWNGRTDLPWETEVDQERARAHDSTSRAARATSAHPDLTGTALAKLGREGVGAVQRREQNWTLSQFMHGEQGALMCTAKIVETVPWIDAKYYAATQVDRRGAPRRGLQPLPAREVLRALPGERPPGPPARRHHQRLALGHDLPRHAGDGRGPRARGVQLHAPAHPRAAAEEAAALRDGRRGAPRRVRRAQPPGGLRAAERRRGPRAPGVRLRGGRAHARPHGRPGGLGPPRHLADRGRTARRAWTRSATSSSRCLFSKIVPNCKKLGLLDAADGWLRTKFTEMGVIAFENYEDTTLEIDQAADGSPAMRADL